MKPARERIIHFGPARRETPRLSVLVPFHRHDPSPLLERMGRTRGDVEFILLDDGSGSVDLLARAITAVQRLEAPAQIVVWAVNRGRADARNRLAGEARGEYVLFLDADMIPDSRDFLARWLDVAQRERPFAAFGGLSLRHARATRETALHHNLFSTSDCRPARERMRAPEQFTAAANLLVRRDFLMANPFDEGFVGWGFEDVEWALRASRRAPILHVDNPATHGGLDDVTTLLRKSKEAAVNFARLAVKHPSQVSRFAAHRAARALRLWPARRALRRACAWMARDPWGTTPMLLRRAALRLYRVSCYAERLA
jgi:hypothetical protein